MNTFHAFYFSNGETDVSIKNNIEHLPWSELTELYFNFLQASGYVLTRKDFADQVQEDFNADN